MAEEVAQRRSAVEAESAQQVAQIRQDAETRAVTRRRETLDSLERELGDLRQRARERVEAAAQMVMLTTKDSITAEILEEVRVELARLVERADFPQILEALLAELLQDAPEGDVILAPPQHVAVCRNWLARNGHSRLQVEPSSEFRDGVAIQDARRRFRVTNTLSARFEKRKEALRKFCLHELFGDSSSERGKERSNA